MSGLPDRKLVCRHVWKIFGSGAGDLLRPGRPPPSTDDLARAGLVGAVRDVDLEVGTGEIFVIMGLSGSGKSTLVRCLSRLVEPTSGEILFNGENLLAASDAQYQLDLFNEVAGALDQRDDRNAGAVGDLTISRADADLVARGRLVGRPDRP